MKYLLLILLTLPLINTELSKKYFKHKSIKRPQIQVNPKEYSTRNYAFYKASITGDKSLLPKKVKNLYKSFGLIHILTPSGIHLASILLLFKFSKIVEIISLLLISFIIFKNGGLYSLERVIIFKAMYMAFPISKKYKIEFIFILTLVSSLLLGHYQASPLSLLFSMLFWGTIIIFRDNPLKVIIYLNISLWLVSAIQGSSVHPLSLLVNPLLTLIFSLVFPFLMINAIFPPIQFLDQFANFFIEFYINTIIVISNNSPLQPFTMAIAPLVLFTILLYFRKPKIAALSLCLFCAELAPEVPLRPKSSITNLGHPLNIIKRKNGKVYFSDRICSVRYFGVRCRRRGR